jgi:hypothetical protein
MNGWESVRVAAAAGVGEEAAVGVVAGAEVACSEGAAFGGGGDDADRDPGRLSASATALLAPGVCRISVVYSVMYASWRCCLADHGGDTHPKAATSGLWSVTTWNCLPSSIKRKCRRAENTAVIKRGVTTLH